MLIKLLRKYCIFHSYNIIVNSISINRFVKSTKQEKNHEHLRVTDSTNDIGSRLAEFPIIVVPLYVTVNGHSYQDKIDLTGKNFIVCNTSDPNQATATPSPNQFIEAYEKAVEQGAKPFFHSYRKPISYGGFSRTAPSNLRVPVYAVDSGNLSMAEA